MKKQLIFSKPLCVSLLLSFVIPATALADDLKDIFYAISVSGLKGKENKPVALNRANEKWIAHIGDTLEKYYQETELDSTCDDKYLDRPANSLKEIQDLFVIDLYCRVKYWTESMPTEQQIMDVRDGRYNYGSHSYRVRYKDLYSMRESSSIKAFKKVLTKLELKGFKKSGLVINFNTKMSRFYTKKYSLHGDWIQAGVLMGSVLPNAKRVLENLEQMNLASFDGEELKLIEKLKTLFAALIDVPTEGHNPGIYGQYQIIYSMLMRAAYRAL
ncbi:MAG: hypothetical protein HOE90_15445 [Bacteriovoracaceae bacterium]|jgi:hypothetical protein|nr:hypothetical protein [Bacteriovoracaceae bacterium]